MVTIFQAIKIKKIGKHFAALKFVFNFIFNWVLWMIVAVPLHEYSHLATLAAFGGDGYIRWNVTTPTTLPGGGTSQLIIALMGGFGVMIIYFLLVLVIDDTEERCALSAIAIEEAVYGVGEMLSYAGLGVNVATFSLVGYLIGIIPTMLVLWRKFARAY